MAPQVLVLPLVLSLMTAEYVQAELPSPDSALPDLVLTEKQSSQEVAEKEKAATMSLGLGLGVFMQPEEADYQADSVPVTVFFTWQSQFQKEINLEVGYAEAYSTLNYRAYKVNWENRLTTRSLYLSYRIYKHFGEETAVFAKMGLAYATADLQINKKAGSGPTEIGKLKDTGFGYLAGTGFNQQLGVLTIGLELNFLSRTARFDGIANAVGYLQMMFFVQYPF